MINRGVSSSPEDLSPFSSPPRTHISNSAVCKCDATRRVSVTFAAALGCLPEYVNTRSCARVHVSAFGSRLPRVHAFLLPRRDRSRELYLGDSEVSARTMSEVRKRTAVGDATSAAARDVSDDQVNRTRFLSFRHFFFSFHFATARRSVLGCPRRVNVYVSRRHRSTARSAPCWRDGRLFVDTYLTATTTTRAISVHGYATHMRRALGGRVHVCTYTCARETNNASSRGNGGLFRGRSTARRASESGL